jgi:ribosomal protein S17E
MTRYLEIKPGSISEAAKKLNEDYQDFFKKELEKTGKSLASMTDAEKKAFYNRIDKEYNAKNEAAPAAKPNEQETTLVAKPGDKEKVIRISKDKLSDYKSKGWVEAESFVPEAAKEPYAIGMAAAMKQTGDKPPLKKSTITKAHDIAKSIEKKEEVKEETLEEGGMKEIDTNKKELERLSIRLSNLRDRKNANAGGDTTDVEKQIKQTQMSVIDLKKKLSTTKKEEVENVEEAAGPDRLTNLNDKISRLQVNLQKLDKSKPESKTKEAIIKSDLATAKLRLQDLMQKKYTETKQESVNEAKKNYKSMKKSLKKEQDKEVDSKRTLTDKPITKIDVDPKVKG